MRGSRNFYGGGVGGGGGEGGGGGGVQARLSENSSSFLVPNITIVGI